MRLRLVDHFGLLVIILELLKDLTLRGLLRIKLLNTDVE